ncbi:hypothetical protein Fot_49998 [Forsythia ovata]|uniref:Uncharacterized protein n=1 Tax=Forsythia ovata TaxID=205694 RepID=A0ABD1PWV8_9LAMI
MREVLPTTEPTQPLWRGSSLIKRSYLNIRSYFDISSHIPSGPSESYERGPTYNFYRDGVHSSRVSTSISCPTSISQVLPNSKKEVLHNLYEEGHPRPGGPTPSGPTESHEGGPTYNFYRDGVHSSRVSTSISGPTSISQVLPNSKKEVLHNLYEERHPRPGGPTPSGPTESHEGGPTYNFYGEGVHSSRGLTSISGPTSISQVLPNSKREVLHNLHEDGHLRLGGPTTISGPTSISQVLPNHTKEVLPTTFMEMGFTH